MSDEGSAPGRDTLGDGEAAPAPDTSGEGDPAPAHDPSADRRRGGSVGADYHGNATWRLANDHLWVDVLATAGPRIIRLGLAGSARNLLAETPDIGWQTPNGRYELFGGHRLWFAPEDPDRVAVPDGGGLRAEPEPDGIRLTGRVEQPTGLVRSMALRLRPGRAALEVRHELCNVGDAPIELAPWTITQLPLGGTVLLPQAAPSDVNRVRPNRMLVLWPYTSWEDPRLGLRDGLLSLNASDGPSLKVGYFNDAGWVAYLRDGTILVRRFEPRGGLPHPDLGCNVEVFIGDRFVELELVGQLGLLAPGSTATLLERWEVGPVDPTDGDDLRVTAARLTGSGAGSPASSVADSVAGVPGRA
jgi:hypothetical protein